MVVAVMRTSTLVGAIAILLRHLKPIGHDPSLRQDFFDRARIAFMHIDAEVQPWLKDHKM